MESAYRMILGREPESAEVVTGVASDFATVDDLRLAFFASDEFKQNAPVRIVSQLHAAAYGLAPISVDVDVSAANLKLMFERTEQSWNALGKTEPFWSVMTHDKYRSNEIDQNKAAFYDTGKVATEAFVSAAARAGVSLGSFGTCLELGCGVGRLTVWLAQIFQKVIACDISNPHLETARDELERRDCQNVELRLTDTIRHLASLPSFDAFISLIVLQHNTPPVAAFLLSMLLEKLNPGGVAYFQIPSYRVGYRFDAQEYLDRAKTLEMEMHVVPQKDLFAIIDQCGCTVLEMREDGWTGDTRYISNSFLLQKRV